MYNDNKRDFFRDALVPTATLVHVLMSVMDVLPESQSGTGLRARVDVALDYVANTVLDAPAGTDLSGMEDALLELRATLEQALKAVNIKNGSAFSFLQLLQLPSQIGEKLRLIYQRAGTSPGGAEAWLRSYVPRNAPLRERFNSWRSLTKMSPEKVFMDLGMPIFGDIAATLSNSAERQKARALWDIAFGTAKEERKPREETRAQQGGPIPNNIAVVQLPSGYLEVTAILDPKRLVTPTDDGWVDIPKELAAKLTTRRKVKQCAYTQLPETVRECEQWLAGIRTEAATLQKEYNAFIESRKSSKLMERLQSQFSADEIAELARQFGQR